MEQKLINVWCSDCVTFHCLDELQVITDDSNVTEYWCANPDLKGMNLTLLTIEDLEEDLNA